MRKVDRRGIKMGLLIMVLAALFLLTSPMFLQTQIWGLDSDGDGFENPDEESGITLMCKEPGDTYYNVPITFQECQPGLDRKECVDPYSKDLFLILRQIDPLIPRPGDPDFDPDFDLYELLRNSHGDDGLGINVIDVLASNPNLEDCSDVINTEFSGVLGAVVIEERDYDPNGRFGDSDYTYPYISGTKGAIFTQAISDYVEDNCDNAEVEVCIDHDSGTTDISEIIRLYIRHTMCHEIGHLLHLRGILDARFGAHYGSSRKTILEEEVLMTAKGPAGRTSVEFFITNDFTDEDFYSAILMEY